MRAYRRGVADYAAALLHATTASANACWMLNSRAAAGIIARYVYPDISTGAAIVEASAPFIIRRRASTRPISNASLPGIRRMVSLRRTRASARHCRPELYRRQLITGEIPPNSTLASPAPSETMV